jgi:hypothetical protein
MKQLMIVFLLIIICVTSFGQKSEPVNVSIDFSNRTKQLSKLDFDSKGDLIIKPSPTSSKNDLDYLIGSWRLYNRKLKKRLANSTEWIEFESSVANQTLLQGIGNLDVYLAVFDGKPYKGVALRLFNPETKLWSIYWTGSNTGGRIRPWSVRSMAISALSFAKILTATFLLL